MKFDVTSIDGSAADGFSVNPPPSAGDARRVPHPLAAFRQARADRVQVSLNLAYGSAMASIGLTIPAIALASRWIDGPLVLGLDPTQVVLLAITVVVSVLTVVPGRAKTLHGGLHLVLLASFLFLAASP